ncbi:hypothetical protein EI976_05225 [Bacillus licheniformis]|uniref:hypothetical protein n=1 Tax=Bacillus licheniformis TaxID=1402 RepID=UPI00049492A1|nr:hypothetical protein [Bacillus licheniformis]AYC51968.1 hypothetical protein C7M53_11965 [Bacillus licheniformis]KAA0813105.1 hypothetical protein EI978_08085 [Bacillus licheniformis]KAA0821294.1 hypothetical protein EI973_19095 [Bacillus licheniformis]KAA0826446.1 hypothetical protein EI976_05225 [Bacillus licheniformis]MBU8781551.1 hypothetical protein [Bacillus licheniformis]
MRKLDKTAELLNILSMYPEREPIFMYPNEGSDHPYTLGYPSRILIDSYITLNDRVWLFNEEKDELFEEIADSVAEDLYTEFPLTNDQSAFVEKQAKKKIESLAWKKAIVVYIKY